MRVYSNRLNVAKKIFVFGILANILLLIYFKYANFFLSEILRPLGGSIDTLDVILPLGISFFTFTQIAFLVDVYKGKSRENKFIQYLLFVTWFPHLIAGPVLHHNQMMPQFQSSENAHLRSKNLAYGIIFFIVGLSKKLLIADPFGEYADLFFKMAESGHPLSIASSWTGALTYTFQIYFDFSGYSDMAFGLSMLFGIRLPINFNSPYKSVNIIEFWRRWHITLSNFLRDYLYIPLGGNRHGSMRRYFNLLCTMALGGLWHGASWTFIVWGLIHGTYLCRNYAFQWFIKKLQIKSYIPSFISKTVSVLLTFICVIIGWVYFRADSVSIANKVVLAMFGCTKHTGWADIFNIHTESYLLIYLISAFSIVWFSPNIYKVMEQVEDVLEKKTIINSYANLICYIAALFLSILFLGSIISQFGTNVNSPFLYFQF